MNRKLVALLGFIVVASYVLSLLLLIIWGGALWQITFEIVTMLSAFWYVVLVLVLPSNKPVYKNLAVIFVSGLLVTTSIVHMVGIAMVRLLQQGIPIPEYVQIGQQPSLLTAVEYFAWCVFLGLALLFSGIAIKKEHRLLRFTLYVCAALCLIGFFASFINPNLLYIASLGYGLGAAVMSACLWLEKPA